MDNNSDKIFDDYIRSEMEDAQADVAFDAQWERMEVAIDKGSFWRFAFSRFNVYYLIITGVLPLLILGSYHNTVKNSVLDIPIERAITPIVSKKVVYQTVTDSVDVDVKPKANDSLNRFVSKNEISVQINDHESLKTEINSSKIQNVQGDYNHVNAVEISNKQPEILPVSISPVATDSVSKPKVKKIRYVTKRDTLISHDTTKFLRKR